MFSKHPEEHIDHLKTVFRVLDENNLSINVKKSFFFQKKVKYLGHYISEDGIEVDPEKIEAIEKWPNPTSVRHIRQFMGLASYYRRFIPKFAAISAPLTDLTKKGASDKKGNIVLNPMALTAFVELKRLLTSTPVLKAPDTTTGNFHIHTDASRLGIGAVLEQEGEFGNFHPVAFISRKLKPTEAKANSIYELELLAVLYALEKWQVYLEGQPSTTVHTDHKALIWFQTQKCLTRIQTKVIDTLSRFNLKIKYKPGSINTVADALSRREDYEASLENYDSVEAADVIVANMTTSIVTISSLQEFQRKIAQGNLKDSNYSNKKETETFQKIDIKDNQFLWYYNPPKDSLPPRLCIPAIKELRSLILHQHHAPTYFGHNGPLKMKEYIGRSYYWPGLKLDCDKWHQQCDSCQRMKHDRFRNKRAPAALWKAPDQPFHTVGIDFIGKLTETTKGNTAILSVIDRLTKRAYFIPCKTTNTAAETADLFLKYVFKNEGLPTQILSDRGSIFISEFWEALWSKLGVSLALSSAYHPQTDGVTERVNASIKTYLRAYAQSTDWDDHLHVAEFAYNSGYHSTIRMTPFEATKGYHPRGPADYIAHQISTHYPAGTSTKRAKEYQAQLQTNLNKAIDALNTASISYKRKSDATQSHWVEGKFEVGNQVLLSTANIQSVDTIGKHSDEGMTAATRKLMPLYIGPFTITQLKGPPIQVPAKVDSKGTVIRPAVERHVSVKLNLPTQLNLSPIRHISELRPYYARDSIFDTSTEIGVPPPRFQEHYVKALLKHDTKLNAYLVACEGSAPNTWEPVENLLPNAQELIDEYWRNQPRDIRRKARTTRRINAIWTLYTI